MADADARARLSACGFPEVGDLAVDIVCVFGGRLVYVHACVYVGWLSQIEQRKVQRSNSILLPSLPSPPHTITINRATYVALRRGAAACWRPSASCTSSHASRRYEGICLFVCVCGGSSCRIGSTNTLSPIPLFPSTHTNQTIPIHKRTQHASLMLFKYARRPPQAGGLAFPRLVSAVTRAGAWHHMTQNCVCFHVCVCLPVGGCGRVKTSIPLSPFSQCGGSFPFKSQVTELHTFIQ